MRYESANRTPNKQLPSKMQFCSFFIENPPVIIGNAQPPIVHYSTYIKYSIIKRDKRLEEMEKKGNTKTGELI